MITEPGENTTVFTMFGSKQDSNTGLIDLIIVKVDLAAVHYRKLSVTRRTFISGAKISTLVDILGLFDQVERVLDKYFTKFP